MTVSGFWMFKVVKRLKLLKKPLRKLLFDHGNLYDNVKKLRHELDEAQKTLDSDPNNVELREEEAAYLKDFNDALLLEERFLVQKAKVDWLRLGDVNSAYFHKVVKSQAARNRIDSVTTNTGVCVDGDQVPLAFIDHYTEFLGQQGNTSNFNSSNLFCNRLTSDVANHIVRDVSDKEIHDAMFSMGNNKARGSPRCAFKVDIQKAYDTVDWKFLEDGKRGLRQGDPMSPYLFTLVMEVLTLMLHRKVRKSECFTYHRYCSKLNIKNLCFADDLFLFAHGDMDSAWVIMDSMDEFKNASGLIYSLPKSTAYFCNLLNYVKIGILNVLPFEEGKLPIKYLGVPLVPSRLLYRDCAELMENVKRRISDWKNKSLSLAGRVQLIRFFLLL
ncbi:reverse transcriptase domain, reverse transcriptase zinc-binding domain protein [Tanacetum coccineum]